MTGEKHDLLLWHAVWSGLLTQVPAKTMNSVMGRPFYMPYSGEFSRMGSKIKNRNFFFADAGQTDGMHAYVKIREFYFCEC